MTRKNLEQLLRESPSTVDMLRNSQIGAYVYPVVPNEFSNWRDEQRAWRETAVLYDQSHHMAELLIEGPEAAKLLSYLGVNSLANFPVNRAKHFVPCSHSGHVIGDVIMFHLDDNLYNLVGRVPTVNWVEFNAKTGGYRVKVSRDDRSPSRPMGQPVLRRHYRFQIQGPNAPQILEKLNGGPVPDVRFFHMDTITIGGRKVRGAAPRHGGRAGPRSLGSLRGRRGNPRGDPRCGGKTLDCVRSEPAPMRPTHSNPAGSPHRCPLYTPAME